MTNIEKALFQSIPSDDIETIWKVCKNLKFDYKEIPKEIMDILYQSSEYSYKFLIEHDYIISNADIYNNLINSVAKSPYTCIYWCNRVGWIRSKLPEIIANRIDKYNESWGNNKENMIKIGYIKELINE